MDRGWVAEATARAGLLAAARAGDAEAFADLVRPHRRALHLYCYRMTGSLTAAGEVTSDALVRARRGLGGYRAEFALHPWLLRVATIACLRADGRRPRRSTGPVGVEDLQPYPDALLAHLTPVGPDPAERSGHAGMALPFLAALQSLPARQRAVTVLHDVLGRPADEVARALGLAPGVIAKSLETAREALAALPGTARDDEEADTQLDDTHLVAEFERACRAGEVRARSLRLGVLLGDDPGQWRFLPTRANRSPALAGYERSGGDHLPRLLAVVTVRRGRIVEVAGFTDPELLAEFGLPTTLPGRRGSGCP